MATSDVPLPTGQDVADFLGQGESFVTLAGEAVTTITAMARAYTRDKGFTGTTDVAEDIAAVIVTAAARLVANPEQIDSTVGGVRTGKGFSGWSLAETFVLDRYRKKAL